MAIKGVTWNRRQQKWKVSIKVDGKYYTLGFYETLVGAKEMYSLAEDQGEGDGFFEWFHLNFHAQPPTPDQNWMIKFEGFCSCYRQYTMEGMKNEFPHLYNWYNRQRAYARENQLAKWKLMQFSQRGIELT